MKTTTNSAWTSAGTSTFGRLVTKRQKLVAARARFEALIDADPCDRACKCAMRPTLDAAQTEMDNAAHEVACAQESWDSYCAINDEGRAANPARVTL